MRARTIRIGWLAVGLAIAGPAGTVAAQQTGATVTGTVRAADSGEPVSGALVRLPELDRVSRTAGAGRFAFADVPAGEYVLVVEAFGGAVHEQRVEVLAGGSTDIVLSLAPAAVRMRDVDVVLDRFRVVGGPRQLERIPGSAHLIGPEELADQKLLYDDVNQILRQVPGVAIQEEEGYGRRPNIGIRGAGSERSSKITLMEDGVLAAPAPYAAPAAYYFPVAGRMEAIELRKGSSQIKYGPHTIGGALNLVSSPIPEALDWTLDLEGGENASGKVRARVGDSYEHVGWLAETYQLRTDGFKRLDGGGDTGFEIGDWLAKLRLRTDPDARIEQALELKLGWYDETSDETYLGLTEADFRADPLRRYAASQEDVMEAEFRQIELRHRIRPAAAVDVSTVLYRHDFQRNWYKLESVAGEGLADVLDDPAAFPEALAILRGATSEPGALGVRAGIRDYYAQGIQSIVGIELDGVGRHVLELGARYHQDQEDRFQHQDGWQMVAGSMLLTERGAPGSNSNRVSDAAAWSFFVQDEITAGRWTITPGVRYETIDFERRDYSADDPDRTAPTLRESAVDGLIPGLGVTLDAAASLQLFGGVHRGFGPPGPGVDEETEPEESVNYELGARWRRGESGAQLVGFHHDYQNILGRATLAGGDPAGSDELFNGGAVTVQGLELSLNTNLTAGLTAFRVPVALAYTYTAAEFETSFTSDYEPWGTVVTGDELPYVPTHQLHVSAGLERGPWELRLVADHVAAMRATAGSGPIPSGQGTDGATIYNASGELRVTPWSAVFVGVRNLTDEAYVVARRPAGARPGLPRTLLAGVRLTP